jgi:hypothetical protein
MSFKAFKGAGGDRTKGTTNRIDVIKMRYVTHVAGSADGEL